MQEVFNKQENLESWNKKVTIKINNKHKTTKKPKKSKALKMELKIHLKNKISLILVFKHPWKWTLSLFLVILNVRTKGWFLLSSKI